MEQSSIKNKLLVWFLACDLVAINVWIGWQVYGSIWGDQVKLPQEVASTQPVLTSFGCDSQCQAYVDTKISEALALKTTKPTPTPTTTATPTPKSVVIPLVKSKVRNTSYLPILGSGSTTANDWADISGTEFYFDKSVYPGLVEVRLEGTIGLLNGNGVAYFRLFDATHGIGVQGSDIKTSNQSSSAIESGEISFWSGKNLIRVQAKSLTADTAVFYGGRLRIITEN